MYYVNKVVNFKIEGHVLFATPNEMVAKEMCDKLATENTTNEEFCVNKYIPTHDNYLNEIEDVEDCYELIYKRDQFNIIHQILKD